MINDISNMNNHPNSKPPYSGMEPILSTTSGRAARSTPQRCNSTGESHPESHRDWDPSLIVVYPSNHHNIYVFDTVEGMRMFEPWHRYFADEVGKTNSAFWFLSPIFLIFFDRVLQQLVLEPWGWSRNIRDFPWTEVRLAYTCHIYHHLRHIYMHNEIIWGWKKWENRKAPVWGDAGYLYWA